MHAPRPNEPAGHAPHDAARGPDLSFCAVCQVSIAASEIASGEARRTPRGRLFCGVCTQATPDERARRRTALEEEFADDAPVPVPLHARRAGPAGAGIAAREPGGRGTPPDRASADGSEPVAEARIGELERAVFRLKARVTFLEERLQELLARVP